MPLTYDSISTKLFTGESSHTFSSIPQTYTDLRLVLNLWSTSAGDIDIRVNGITSSVYYTRQYNATNSALTYSRLGNAGQMYVSGGVFSGSSGYGSVFIMDFFNYANTNGSFKNVLWRFGKEQNSTASNHRFLWSSINTSTSGISSILITAGASALVSPSSATLYGITKA